MTGPEGLRSADDDRDLVQAVTERGDQRAFQLLYDRHTPYLYRLGLRLTAGDEQATGDIVHDAWVRSVERLGSFVGRSALRTWLAGFVVNLAREYSRHAAGVDVLDAADPAGAEDPADQTLARIDVERALATLPPGYRRVLVLHDLEGYTHAEIAGLLDIDAGTSKSQLARARARLRARAAGEGGTSA